VRGVLLLAATLLVGACAGPPAPEPATPPPPAVIDDLAGVSIIVSGQRVRVGAPVITWRDPGGHDAYQERCAFRDAVLPSSPAAGCDTPRRWSERDDPSKVDLVVVHYDVAWSSRNCFKVLHDLRGLSCHFLLDVDGTIYQTLDVVHRGRHAAGANERSIGIEIAHPGPLELDATLAPRYTRDPDGRTRFDLGRFAPDVRTPDFVVRPARPEPIAGPIHGKTYTQYDFTEEQYRSLAHLLAALARALPRVRLEAPRDPAGKVLTGLADPEQLGPDAGVGVVGHHHVGSHKQDPGPAFDWERVLSAARAIAR
jgi:N-acetylmuramoyl-L-alanine amidase